MRLVEYGLREALNRFLLSKAFEKQEGSFIVGQIEGDSCTTHLPYVQVEKR